MSVSVEIKNGILDVLTEGIFLVNATDPTTLTLRVNNEELKLIIKFVSIEKDDKVKKEAKVIDNTTLEIIFTNYNNSIGNYTKEFWKIGSIINRSIYWGYVIYGFDEGNIKKIEYTFYLGEEVQNG